ncbi:MAG: hypothetical protein E6J77_01235 [Deltaproteobacteria bacterium]|nr:MAG: hypothetical protein E6J77_01235 [Deltaproteobacteria bacterium]
MRRMGLFLSVVMLAGCVHLVVRPYQRKVDAQTGHVVEDTDKDAHGVRFYRPAPYLWLASDKDGKCVPTVLYLPDPTQEYIMQVSPWDGALGIGTVSMKPTLQDGWNLTGLDSSVDTKVPETLTAVTGLAKAAMGVTPEGVEVERPVGKATKVRDQTTMGPGLYRIVLRPNEKYPLDFEPVLQVKDGDKVVPCTTFGSPASVSKKDGGGEEGKRKRKK